MIAGERRRRLVERNRIKTIIIVVIIRRIPKVGNLNCDLGGQCLRTIVGAEIPEHWSAREVVRYEYMY